MNLKSPSEICDMVKQCPTKELQRLQKRAEKRQKEGFSLYREMISLAIQHELTERQKKDTTTISTTIITKGKLIDE